MDNLINRKVLVQYMIDHFRADWSFHDLINAISQVPLQNAQQWIPIAERLPKTEDGYAHVMVSMDDGFVCATDYTDSDGFELWADSGQVIAWMPLPEPYRSAT